MHHIEPFFNWRDIYTAESDEASPFYGRQYNELAFETTVYGYYIHPQWDSIESETFYVKLLYANYESGHAIIELFGEWNDAIGNDISLLKNNFIDVLLDAGISKFLLIGEHVFNFHGSEDDYYAEWFEACIEEAGWIIGINFRDFVLEEMNAFNIGEYIQMSAPFNEVKWRKFKPDLLLQQIDQLMNRWIEQGLNQLGN